MKNNHKIYTMKEASEITGFQPHVIRYYETEFQLKIPRNESNRRYFTYKELEELEFIKSLQEKGLTNPQIRQVLKSPKVILDSRGKQETAISSNVSKPVVKSTDISNEVWVKEAFQYMQMELRDSLKELDYRREIQELSEKVEALRSLLENQEKDVLLCENAKLKMKVKEKSYEVADLKDQLKRKENQKVSFFDKLFSNKRSKQKLV
ncbi:helix-turn-helix domain-containing protein [Alkaliphilus crotonatoxidans]